jgi:hypothetical protein
MSALNYPQFVALLSVYQKYAEIHNDGSFLQGSKGCAFMVEHKLFPYGPRSFDSLYTRTSER